jgi:hypothetical protein
MGPKVGDRVAALVKATNISVRRQGYRALALQPSMLLDASRPFYLMTASSLDSKSKWRPNRENPCAIILWVLVLKPISKIVYYWRTVLLRSCEIAILIQGRSCPPYTTQQRA